MQLCKKYIPLGQSADAKTFFSGKHYLYRLKKQVIIGAMGAALDTIASKGYTSKEYENALITPFKRSPIDLDDDKNVFNPKHASVYEVVEQVHHCEFRESLK